MSSPITAHSKRLRLGAFSVRLSVPRVLLYVLILALVAFTALPLIYVVSTAFKPADELFLFPPRFFVQNPTGENFRDLLEALDSTTVPFSRSVFNSLFVAVVTVALTVMMSCSAAYGMVKHKIPFGKAVFSVIVAALMFSPQVTQIPTYLIVKDLGLHDTYAALIVTKIAVAYNVFLIRQFTEQLPDAFLEAARLDGANEWQIFTRIVMPFLKPAWSTLVVFSFVSTWNDYFTPLVYTSREELKTLPLVLQTIGENGNVARAGAVGAATLIMTLPTVILFSLMQKNVLETMTYSGIK